MCQLHLNKTEKTKKEKLLQAAIKAPSQRLVGWTQTGKPLKKKTTIFIISILIFAYPSILQKEEREKKERRASQTLHLIMVPVSIFLLNTSSSHFDTHMANVKVCLHLCALTETCFCLMTVFLITSSQE